jgi:hypothetical protein
MRGVRRYMYIDDTGVVENSYVEPVIGGNVNCNCGCDESECCS